MAGHLIVGRQGIDEQQRQGIEGGPTAVDDGQRLPNTLLRGVGVRGQGHHRLGQEQIARQAVIRRGNLPFPSHTSQAVIWPVKSATASS